MKLNLNLSLTAKPAQRWAQPAQTATPLVNIPALTPTGCPTRKYSPFNLLSTRATKPVRIPAPILGARSVFRGNKSYLRAMREAELAAWNASIKFPTF